MVPDRLYQYYGYYFCGIITVAISANISSVVTMFVELILRPFRHFVPAFMCIVLMGSLVTCII